MKKIYAIYSYTLGKMLYYDFSDEYDVIRISTEYLLWRGGWLS